MTNAAKTNIKLCMVVGPTAVGKSEVAYHLARHFDGEVINADSMQLYRGLEIGTAKPSLQMRRQIPHHLYDLLAPGEMINAADYARLAHEVITKVHAANHLPIVVGGSGLYLRALEYGLCATPRIDKKIRNNIKMLELEKGLTFMHQRLKEVDLLASQRIHHSDAVRIRRALEVHAATGRSFSELQAEHGFGQKAYSTLKIGLQMRRETLYQRINSRMQQMFVDGLLDEVEAFPVGKERGIGYLQARLCKQGSISQDEAIATAAKETRNFAKRQLTWFRQDSDIEWYNNDEEVAARTLQNIKARVGKFLAVE